ncbi:MAG: hypothetical protein NXI31_13270 [bacterium]|nr:hypothetical protein [bacterium]
MRSFACLLPAALAVTPLVGQQLVADLNQTPPTATASSFPADFVSLGGRVVFAATTSEGGREPWVTDGTAPGTVRLIDVTPGSGGSNPKILAAYGGQVVFSAIQPGVGLRYYATDGTPAGTSPLAPLPLPTTTSLEFYTLEKTGNLLITAGSDTYASDLTAAGTQLIPGMSFFVPRETIGVETFGTTFDTGTGEWAVWATDGTLAGSRQITAGLRGRAHGFVAWNGRVYFLEPEGVGVWISSTHPINGGIQRHALLASFVIHPQTAPMFRAGNRFVATIGGKCFTSDLTQAGSGEIVLPIAGLGDLHELNGTLYLRGSSPANGFELWTTDGTVAGTSLVADLDPGTPGSHPEHIRVFDDGTGDALWFRAIIGGTRSLMKCTNPTTVQNLGPIPLNSPTGSGGLNNSDFVPLNDGLLFSAGGQSGVEPWFGSATQAPAEVVDLNATAPGIRQLPRESAALGDELFLIGTAGSSRYELIITDGTQARTFDVVSNNLAALGLGFSDLVRYGDRIAFSTIEGTSLTGGTPATTTPIFTSTTTYTRRQVRVVDNRIYFLDNGLMVSDGVSPPVAIPAMPIFINDFEVLRDQIVGVVSSTLYGTDGVTPAVPLETLVDEYGRLGDRMVYTRRVFPNTEIKVTDGTVTGTSTVSVLNSTSVRFAFGPEHAWFYADGQLIKTDGTVAGTQATTTQPGLTIRSLVATTNELFALIEDSTNGRELWRFDENISQFVLVLDIAPGQTSGVTAATAIGDGDLLLLAAGTPATGIEPWISDGTTNGTFPLNEIQPGPGSSNPTLAGIAGNHLFLIANDGVHGRELWRVDLGATGAAYVQDYGSGCLGAGGFARLGTNTAPTIGSSLFGIVLDQVAPNTLTAISLGSDTASIDIGGCQLLVNGILASTVGLSNGSGTASMQVSLPNDPGLVGFRFTAQGAAIDGAAAAGFVTSGGLIVTVGR